MNHKWKLALIPALLASLAACGGGGGGGSSYGGPTKPASMTDVASADQVAAGYVDANNASDTPTTNTKPSLKSAMSKAMAASTSTTIQCSTQGTITLSGAADGSSGSLVFNNCIEPYGMMAPYMRTNGTLGYKNIVPQTITTTGVAGTDEYTMSQFKFEDLSAALAPTGNYALQDGGYRVAYTTDVAQNIETDDMTASRLYLKATLGVPEEALFENVHSVMTLDNTTFEVLTECTDGTLSSTKMGGKVTIQCVTPFTYLTGSRFPETGITVLTGEGGAKIQLTAKGGGWVEVGYDIKPVDGNYEKYVMKQFSAM